MVNVTVNFPRPVSFDLIVKTTEPAKLIGGLEGVIVRLGGPETVTLPARPVVETVTVSKPPFFLIVIVGDDMTATHAGGVGSVRGSGVGVGVGVEVGVGVGVGESCGFPPVPFPFGVGVGVGVGLSVTGGVGVGF